MRYVPPSSGPYESGMNIRFMYSVVYRLIKLHATSADIQRLRSISLGSDKLWTKHEIRTELEELIKSYFFSCLVEPSPGLIESFQQPGFAALDHYVSQLRERYASPQELRQALTPVLSEIAKRADHIKSEIGKIVKHKGKQLVKTNIGDAFGTISIEYYGKYANIEEELRTQS